MKENIIKKNEKNCSSIDSNVPSAMERILWIYTSLYKGNKIYSEDYYNKYKRCRKTLERDVILSMAYITDVIGYAVEYYYDKEYKYYVLLFD